MAKHTVTVEEIGKFEINSQLASSFGQGEDKEILITSVLHFSGSIMSRFIVKNEGKIIFTTPFIEDAVDTYNSI